MLRTSRAVLTTAVIFFGASSTGVAQAAHTPDERPVSTEDDSRLNAYYQYDYIGSIAPWRTLTVEGAHHFLPGTVVGRVNLAERFGSRGSQIEVEAYPRLTSRSYLYSAIAVSGSRSVFVPLRLALEPYYSFRNGWEGSAGARYFNTPGPSVFTLTGTIGKYVGNYWFSGRPSLTVIRGTHSIAASMVGRKYFSGRYDYLSVAGSLTNGANTESPDPTRFERTPRLHSYQFSAERKIPLGSRPARFTIGAAYEHEAIAPLRFRNHRSVTVGLEWFQH